MPGPNRIALIAECDRLADALKAAERETLALATDPLSNEAALRDACQRWAFLIGHANGWTAVVNASLPRPRSD